MTRSAHAKDIFINCPFDRSYEPLFHAIVFAVYDLGFIARCALETADSSEVRLSRIERIIDQCEYGIHDLSAVGLDASTGLPRFNMPLELGLFLGCKRFGGQRHRRKVCLILDSDRYRYRAFISDIAGHDIHAHGGAPEQAIMEVRKWMAAVAGRNLLRGGKNITERYIRFQADLPRLRGPVRLHADEMTFSDLSEMIAEWLEANR